MEHEARKRAGSALHAFSWPVKWRLLCPLWVSAASLRECYQQRQSNLLHVHAGQYFRLSWSWRTLLWADQARNSLPPAAVAVTPSVAGICSTCTSCLDAAPARMITHIHELSHCSDAAVIKCCAA